MENAENRSLTIDTFRGLGILLVVLGHTSGLPTAVHNFIYSFHMPAFFILSGYLFNTEKSIKNPAEQIRNKFYRLIIPAWTLGLICGIPFIALLALNKGGINLDIFIQKLIGTLTGYPKTELNFESTPIWFLFALFITEFIATACHSAFKKHAIYALYAIGIAGLLISTKINSYTPFNFTIALTATLFFAIGITARAKLTSTQQPATLLAILASGALLVATNYYTPSAISMAENFIAQPKWLATNIIGALSGTALLYFISRQTRSKTLAWIGTKTLPILAFNYLANIISYKLLSAAGIATWPVTFTVQLLALLIAVYFISKIKPLDILINGQLKPKPKKIIISNT
jgi:fucose 4-O-acetylase-like acetyltransferase